MENRVTTTSTEKRVQFEGAKPSDIRLRAFVLGLLIIPLDNYWIIMMEKVGRGPYPTTISIFANVIFILAILAAANSFLKKLSPRQAFTSAEMLLIYTMTAIGAALAGHDMVPSLMTMLMYPWRFATPENDWAHKIIPHLPLWLSVTDSDAIKGLYEGRSSLYTHGYWRLWVGPLAWWGGFVMVLVWVMMCINTLVRKQWTDRERLTFPIVQLPVAMTEPAGGIWRNRLFWLGFAIAFTIDLNNGLHAWVPWIPFLNTGIVNQASNFTTKPWNAIGWTPTSFYPFVIGLGFLLPVDLLFSCWFFYIFWKLQMVASSALAYDAIPDFPYVRHQAFGGYVAILVMLTWTSRGYLKQVWLRLQKKKSELDDSDEPMSYRTAAAGSLVGLVLLSAFMHCIGLSWVYCVIAFLIYFILATAITRMRAELGPPVHDLHFSGPDFMITNGVGTDNLSTKDMVGLTYFYWFNRAYRCHPMPVGLEGMKMAHSTKSSQKKFLWGIMIAAAVGMVVTPWAYLHLGYQIGIGSAKWYQPGFAGEAFGNLDRWLSGPPDMMKPKVGANMAGVVGFIFCMFLGYMRIRIFNFPFHPIGYAISGSWSMNIVWLPLLFAWLIKLLVMKFGGIKLYRTALPFFFGLILGEMVMGSLWSLIGIAFGIPTWSFWGA